MDQFGFLQLSVSVGIDFTKFSPKTDVENEIKINIELYIESKEERPRDQPESLWNRDII